MIVILEIEKGCLKSMRIKISKDHPLYEISNYRDDEKEIFVIICNRCKTQMLPSNDHDHYSQNFNHSMRANFGYGSKHDMDDWKWDVCENCLLEWAATFEIEPEGFGEGYVLLNEWKTKRQQEMEKYMNIFERQHFDSLQSDVIKLIEFVPKDTGLHTLFEINHPDHECIHVSVEIDVSDRDKNNIMIFSVYEFFLFKDGIKHPDYVWSEEEREIWHQEVSTLAKSIQGRIELCARQYSKYRLKEVFQPIQFYPRNLERFQ